MFCGRKVTLVLIFNDFYNNIKYYIGCILTNKWFFDLKKV